MYPGAIPTRARPFLRRYPPGLSRPLFAFSGSSGSTAPLAPGKRAIAQSIVQYCLDNDIPITRFFFFRSDPTRNTTGPIVAALVVQLIQSMPELQSIIFPIIDADPLIFIKPVKTQLQALVFHPLRQLSNNSINPRTLVFLFDGVDELNGHEKQQTLIRCVSESSVRAPTQ